MNRQIKPCTKDALKMGRMASHLSRDLFDGGDISILRGALAYAVTSRVHEIGVRMALGASHTTIAQMIVRDGVTVAVPGVLIGVPSAVAAARIVRSQRHGATPTDLPTILGAGW